MTYPVLLENKQEAIDYSNFDDRVSVEDRVKFKDSYFFWGDWQGRVFFFFDCSEKKR